MSRSEERGRAGEGDARLRQADPMHTRTTGVMFRRWVADRHPDAQQSATGARSTPPVKAAVYLILGKAATYMGLDLSKPLK